MSSLHHSISSSRGLQAWRSNLVALYVGAPTSDQISTKTRRTLRTRRNKKSLGLNGPDVIAVEGISDEINLHHKERPPCGRDHGYVDNNRNLCDHGYVDNNCNLCDHNKASRDARTVINARCQECL